MLISPAYAQAAGAAPGGGAAFLNAIMPFLLIIPIFYFLLIRPQQRRLKQHREVEVELAAATKVRVVKSTLSEVRAVGTGKPANDTAA